MASDSCSSSHHGREDSSSSSKLYKGVRKRKWGKWVSEIRLPNSRDRIWLGSYDSAVKAARAFDAALYCLRGSGAKFNFPHSPPDMRITRPLTHAEIQEIATSYANEEPRSDGGAEHQPLSPSSQFGELNLDHNNSSNSSSGVWSGNESQIDWPLWNLLDNVPDYRYPSAEYNSFLPYQPADPQSSFGQSVYDSGHDAGGEGFSQHNLSLWDF
uniref:AP2/ERF domain-containing protein n=1 Tax=Kalanchoe fedtschenkoi TaxID=63787 RepID=A0A7N0RCN5_KALFE